MRRFTRLLPHILVTTIITLSALSIVVSLFPSLATTALTRSELVVRRHERLHFSLHLAAGRALSVCPCTRPLAAVQYEKAALHAPTPAERRLVTTERPRRLLDGPGDLITLARYSGWIAVSSPEARGGLALAGIMMAATGMIWSRRLPRRDGGPLLM
jgi:hypothetical protein